MAFLRKSFEHKGNGMSSVVAMFAAAAIAVLVGYRLLKKAAWAAAALTIALIIGVYVAYVANSTVANMNS